MGDEHGRGRALIGVVVSLIVLGCQSPAPVPTPATSEAPAAPGATMDEAPVRELGNEHSEHVVIYEFWAIWCLPCRTEIPNVQELHERFENDDRVHLIAVHYDDRYDDWDSPRVFLDACDATYPTLTNGWRIAHGFGVGAVPCTVVVGRDGRVLHMQYRLRPTGVDRLADLITTHLDE